MLFKFFQAPPEKRKIQVLEIFFQSGFSQNPAEVMVFGKNGSSNISQVTTVLIILFNIVIAIKLF